MFFENSTRTNVTGIYANRELAEKERDERHDLECIDVFEIKGRKSDEDFRFPIFDDCKYFKPRINTIRQLISCLYELDGCCCGGAGHVVIDDENFEDHHIKWCIEYCETEAKDEEEAGLVKLICEELLKLNMHERFLLFRSYDSLLCRKDCHCCSIETLKRKGKTIAVLGNGIDYYYPLENKDIEQSHLFLHTY